jgi:cyclopropane fatty-acyl-phospholipid synthase-like methyltransferase
VDTSLYLDGTYLQIHPGWHIEDSEWKASKVLQMLHRNHLEVGSIVEVGCGAGEVLACLQKSMSSDCVFRGYEIAPDAYRMCHSRANDRLSFSMQWSNPEIEGRADLAMALDVVEHVEDYFSFLRNLREQGEYCILHVPLDLSLQSLLFNLPQRVRKTAGHLHYFTAPILQNAVRDCGFTIIDSIYTRPGIERPSKSLAGKLARYPRLVGAAVNEPWAALILGGFSMMILAKRNT